MPSGGSIQGVTIKGRYFPVDKDCDASLVLGGYTNEKKANGDGSSRNVKVRRLGGTKGLILSVDNERGDQEFLKECADALTDFDTDITLVDGVVYSGACQIEGEFEYKTMDSTCEIELKGTMEKQ
jgi:hypothetical protein